MEGEGEGMVAVVYGLQDAGLAVSLIGRRRETQQSASNNTGANQTHRSTNTKQLSHAKSSVEIGMYGPQAVNTGSYRMVHCSSPTELPPQRPEPCHIVGNFVVGGSGCRDVSTTAKVPRSPHFSRDSYKCGDKGLFNHSIQRTATENFMHSLRKYPCLSSNKCLSAELVQRLIQYSQAKNFSKSSYHSRSMRALRHKNSESPKDSGQKMKISVHKSVQTYIRAKRGKENTLYKKRKEKERYAEPVTDTDNEGRRRTRRVRSRSPTNGARSLSRLDHSATYNYLKCSRRLSSRMIQVRYLTDMTRCLRDTLRQICEDEPTTITQVCPIIQNRYSEHRRQHHRSSGVQSTSDSNDFEVQASTRKTCIRVPFMSPCQPVSSTTRPRVCCHCRKPIPCACKNTTAQTRRRESSDFSKKIEEAVMSWLQKVPVYASENAGDKAVRDGMARQLIDELRKLKGDEDFEEKATAAIKDCINKMPMWCPGNRDEQDKFKQQIAENLIQNVIDITKEKDKFDDEISKWVKDLISNENISQKEFVNFGDVEKDLVTRLKPIALNSPSDSNTSMKKEILKVLEELPIVVNGDKNTLINELADDLENRLQNIPAKDIKPLSLDLKDEIEKQINKWVLDVPDFSTPSQRNLLKDGKLVDQLAKKLQNNQVRGIDNPDTQERMQNDINKWLEDNAGKKNSLDLKTKEDLTENLLENIIDICKQGAKKGSMRSGENLDNVTREVLNWLKDISELAHVKKNETHKMAESLAKIILGLQSKGVEDSELEDEITNWLITTVENKGGRLNEEKQSYLVNNLLEKINNLKQVTGEDNLKNITNALDDISGLNLQSMTDGEKQKFEQALAKKIAELLSQNLSSEKMKDELDKWMKDYAETSGVRLSFSTKNKILDKLMKVATVPKKPRRRWIEQEDVQTLINSLKEEVTNELNKSNVQSENRDELESELTDILADQIMRGEDEREVENRIVNTLADTNISKDKSEDIAGILTEMAKDMSMLYRSQDSKLFDNRKTLELSPSQKDVYQESVAREIQDFIEDMTGDTSAVVSKKYAATAQEMAEKVADIMLDPEIAASGKKQNIEDNLSKYLEDISLPTDISIPDQANELAERLDRLAYKTSTPKRRGRDKEISFRPRRKSRDLTISSIGTQTLSNSEQKYINELVGIIHSWLDNLPIYTDDKEFKNAMSYDLATDIVDRQKYLQINPEAETSDPEELEHLKYQVFRWLNKLSDVKDVMSIVDETQDLMDRIRDVNVPKLINSSEGNGQATRDSSVQYLSKSLESIQNEIQKWFEAIPSKYASTKDETKHHEMVNDLAEQIVFYNNDESLTESLFQEIVSDWLEKALKNAETKYVNSLIEELKSVLVNKKLITLIDDNLKPDNKKRLSLTTESIKKAVLQWSENLPFETGKTIDDAIDEVKQFSLNVKNITNVVPEESSNVLKSNERALDKEINEFVKKLPVQKNNIRNSHIQELHDQIRELTRGDATKLPSINSKSGFSKSADLSNDNIETWFDNLSLPEGTTREVREEAKALQQKLASHLINIVADMNMNPEIFNDNSLYETILSDEIDNLLDDLPTSPELKKLLPVIKDNLIAKIKETRQKLLDEHAGQAYKQQLREDISKTLPTIENLSIEEQAPFEILRDNLADAYIELHYTADDRDKTKFKEKINEEINQFCNNYLKQYPSSPVDPKRLNIELYNALQKVPVPKDTTLKSQIEQIMIKDIINGWLKTLPLKEDETPSKMLQNNKIVSIMANHLHDTEKEKKNDPALDVEDQMRKEIKKWITKLPIKPAEENDMDQMVEQLIDRLKNSEESRRISVSRIRRSVDFANENSFADDNRTNRFSYPSYSKFDRPTPPCRRSLMSYAPCTLSAKDRACLQRIKERNQKRASCQLIKPPCYCNASVNPIPVESGSQTEVSHQPLETSSAQTIQRQSFPCPAMAPPDCVPCPQDPCKPISPYVIVKEYYWDSPEPNITNTNFMPNGSSEEQGNNGQTRPSLPQYRNSLPQQNVQRFRNSCPEEIPCPQQPPCTLPTTPCTQPQTVCREPSPYRIQPSCPPRHSFTTSSPYAQEDLSSPPCCSPIYRSPQQSTTSQISPCDSPTINQEPSCIYKPSQCKHHPRPCMTEPPPPRRFKQPRHSMRHTPCVSSGQSGHNSPCPRRPASPCFLDPSESYTLPKSSFNRCVPRRPCHNKHKTRPVSPLSSNSSLFDTETPCPSFGLRVTRLGSLDDVPCGRGIKDTHIDDYDWTIKFPEESDFWGTPCPRRKVRSGLRRSPHRDGFCPKQKKYDCRERVMGKCTGRRAPSCAAGALQHCAKCCGMQCPHPTKLFFR